MLTGLISISLPLGAETGARATTSPSAVAPQAAAQQTLTQPQNRTSPNTLPDAPGQTAPAKPASPPPAAPPKPLPAAPATPPSDPPAAQASATDQEPEQAAPGDEEGTYTLKTNVNEVSLTFTVTDHRGHFVNNLQQQDFALLDDQRAPAQVYSFTQQTNQPLRVGLVIDASTSIRARFKFEQQAATEFLLDILRPRTDRAFIMGFDVSSYVTQGFTNNPDLLETGLNRLKPGGGTALYDAVYRACRDQMLKGVPANAEVRKALILVSDGDDNQSRAYLDDAIKMCQRAETTIFTISTNTSPTRERGDDVLKKMASATGGAAFYPQRLEDIANEFHHVGEELRSQYSLAYKPADFRADGSFRTIYLTALRGGYQVHARTGYFAPK
ncbi:MAG TPA: VWA domain-containing protein [Acidobacteriaceae bacterium]|nr:VWA domain-containing protein [Acidobacteriaceae bacterium]